MTVKKVGVSFTATDGSCDLDALAVNVANAEGSAAVAVTDAAAAQTAASAALVAAAGAEAAVNGAVPGNGRTVTDLPTYLLDNAVFNVLDYGAKGDGATDDVTAINLAITKANAAGGGIVYFPVPATTYKIGSTIVMKANVRLQGSSRKASTITYAGTGDGIAFVGTVNVQTLANTAVRDLTIICTNAGNVAGGGYTDLGGTFVELTNVHIRGFGYGIIFDQTELADVDLCNIELQQTGAIWLCNGSDHTPSANTAFTNRISVKRTQINEGTGAYGIIDDGGYAHVYRSNNFNGCLLCIRAAAVLDLVVDGANYFESAGADALIQLEATTRKTGTSVGNVHGVSVVGNMMNQTNSQPCVLVQVTAVNSLSIRDNYLQTNGVALSGLTNASGYISVGPNAYNGSGSLYNGTPFELFVTLVNGANNDVVLPVMIGSTDACPLVQAIGLTGAYSVTGFVAGFAGQRFTLYNRMGFNLTIVHNSGSSAVGNRINSATLHDIIVPDFGSAVFFYDHTEGHWIVESVSLGSFSDILQVGSTYAAGVPAAGSTFKATGTIPIRDAAGAVYYIGVNTSPT